MQISFSSFVAILPELSLFLGACCLMLLPLWKREKPLFFEITLTTLALALLFSFFSVGRFFPNVQSISYLQKDMYSTFFSVLFLVITAVVCLLSKRYLTLLKAERPDFYILLLFSLVGILVMISSQDLLVMYLGLEIMSFSGYVLASYLAPNKKSMEAGLKYFLTGALASAIFLFGMAYLFGATGTLQFKLLGQMAAEKIATTPYFAFGTTLLIVGFAYKVSAVPFQMWAPDVYEGSPTPITAYFAIVVKGASFAIFTKILILSLDGFRNDYLAYLLGALAAGTMLWGNLGALAQTNIKRLLAYSSLAHAGYLLLALSTRSASGFLGSSVMFYFFSYAIASIGAFTVVVLFEKKEGKHLQIDDYEGLFHRYPSLSISMALFLFSLAGIPPTVGFFGKWLLFSNVVSAGKTGFVLLAVLGVSTSLVSVYYYARIVYKMFMKELKSNSVTIETKFKNEQRMISFLAACVLLFGLLPMGVLNLATLAKKSLTPYAFSSISLYQEKKKRMVAKKEKTLPKTLLKKELPAPLKKISQETQPFVHPKKEIQKQIEKSTSQPSSTSKPSSLPISRPIHP